MSFSNIPLPNPSKWGDYSDILQNIMQNKLKGQEQAETAKYHQGELEISRGNLGVAQAAEARAKQLMPYLIQQYKDTHGKEMSEMEMNNLYNGIIKDTYNSAGGLTDNRGAPVQAAPISNQPSSMGFNQPVAPQSSAVNPANNTSMINQFLQPNAGGYTPINNQLPVSPPQQFPLTSIPNQTPQAVATQNIVPASGAPATQNAQQTFPQNESGEEIVRPGNPKLDKLDAIAGLPKSPVKAPEIRYDTKNGWMYTQYPSGKITRQKMSSNQEDEEYRGTNDQERKLNQAEAIKIRTDSNDVKKAAEVAIKMKKLLDKNPDLTGMHNFFSSKTKLLNDKKKGEFVNLAGILQSAFGRMASSRGGAQALAWAKSVKPDLLTGQETNKGMLDATLAQLQDELNNNKDRFQNYSFKPLDVKLPSAETVMKTVIKPDGSEIELPEKGAQQLVADHPDHKIKE